MLRPKNCRTRQVPSCPYGLCDVVSQRPKGAYSARLVGQNVYREIERETVGTVSNIEKSGLLCNVIGSRIIGSSPIVEVSNIFIKVRTLLKLSK